MTCDNLFQIHTIAPLLSIEEIQNFVTSFIASDAELGMSVENIELECLYKDKPLNFSFNKKQNSQELTPVQKISWSMTAWKSKTFPHHDTTFTFPISKLSALVIKTQEDFDICQSLYNLSNKN